MTADVGSPVFVKAGWWDRFTASFIDGLILLAASLGVGLVIGVARAGVNASLAGVILDVAYFVYFWSDLGGGRTPGMRVKGIAVVGTDGRPISAVRAFVRWIMFLVSFYALTIGLLWAAWDRQKQGWHDKVAGTYVIRVGAVPIRPTIPGAAAGSGCPSCGAPNAPGTRFCGACGAALSA
jgi:uncharacterized RDD family membrane protein YckC